MGIEISGTSGRPPQEAAESGKSQAGNPAGPQRAGGGGGTKTAATGGDQLQLSNQVSQLKALEAEIANLPVVDTQRVQDVQRTIATGSFQIQPAEVADKLLRFEAGLGPAQ
jgi:negative regulator of flagellin synthesis FlgM